MTQTVFDAMLSAISKSMTENERPQYAPHVTYAAALMKREGFDKATVNMVASVVNFALRESHVVLFIRHDGATTLECPNHTFRNLWRLYGDHVLAKRYR